MADDEKTLLPPNATAAEQALDLATSRVGAVPVPNGDLWNPDTCPENLLPWLAWALSVDEWDGNWPESAKREAIRRSISIHRIKGTRGAVEQSLAALGLVVRVVEWFEYGGTPGTFRLDAELTDWGLNETDYASIERVVTAAKNARSHLDSFTIALTGKCKAPAIAAASLYGEQVTVYPWALEALEESAPFVVGIGYQAAETVVVYPQ